MADISIKKSYTMSREELKAEVKRLIVDLESKFQLSCRWENEDCVSFTRTGAKGKLEIDDKELRLSMSLGMMLKMFKGKIEAEIAKFISQRVK
jgi:putative polyhydroxyalkanoate system protein